MRLCAFEGCGRAHRARGWCDAHYRQSRSGRSPMAPIVQGRRQPRPDLVSRNATRRKHHRRDAHGNKECSGCGVWKPETEFFRHPSTADHLNPQCRVCTNERTKLWNKENPEKLRDRIRLSKYGITRNEWEQMFAAQDNMCAICKTQDPGLGANGQWNTDHDHQTGKVRGILCWTCNTALGKFKDSTDILRSALAYLEDNQ